MRALSIAALVFLAGLPARGDEPAWLELVPLISRLPAPEARAALGRRLDANPRLALGLSPALDEAYPLPEEAPAPEAALAALGDVVAEAFGRRAHDPRLYVDAVRAPGCAAAVARGVARGAAAAIAAGAATNAEDQAPVSWEGLALLLVAHPDAAARACACDALAGLPPSRATVTPLLAALEDPATAERARAALARLAGGQDPRAWARRFTGAPEASARAALRALVTGPRRDVAARVEALTRALRERPAQTLAALDAALGEDDEPLPDAARALVGSLVAAALGGARDVRPFLEGLEEREAHVDLALGIVDGIARRARLFARGAPRAARRDGEELEEAAAPAAEVERPVVPDQAALLLALEALAERPEDDVRAAVFRALPALLPALDAPWFEALALGLDQGSRAQRAAAHAALRDLGGADLPPSSVLWRRWWQARSQ